MKSNDLNSVVKALTQARSVAIASHARPDADALGSTIAAALWLRECGKVVAAWNEEGVTSKFRYLPSHEVLTLPPATPQSFDVFLALDTSVKNRLGTVTEAIAPGALWINIDHHVSNELFGEINYVDSTAPATGQILFEILQHVGANITPDIASNLFAAISTDTGSFKYEGTNTRTFDAAARLVAHGVNVGALSRAMYDNQPRRRFELLRFALNHAQFCFGDHIATFSLTMADAERLAVLPEDNEGIIDQLRSVENVQAAIFFEELPQGKVRVSARSKDPALDICKVCQLFGGGGHPMAAGARIDGTLEVVRKDFLEALINEIKKRD